MESTRVAQTFSQLMEIPLLRKSKHLLAFEWALMFRNLLLRRLSNDVGLWRSLVARLHGVQEAVGSNPASPTNLSTIKCPFYWRSEFRALFLFLHASN
jgi:hypothetical protein